MEIDEATITRLKGVLEHLALSPEHLDIPDLMLAQKFFGKLAESIAVFQVVVGPHKNIAGYSDAIYTRTQALLSGRIQ